MKTLIFKRLRKSHYKWDFGAKIKTQNENVDFQNIKEKQYSKNSIITRVSGVKFNEEQIKSSGIYYYDENDSLREAYVTSYITIIVTFII